MVRNEGKRYLKCTTMLNQYTVDTHDCSLDSQPDKHWKHSTNLLAMDQLIAHDGFTTLVVPREGNRGGHSTHGDHFF